MGWCVECEREGAYPNHAKLRKGLCEKHYRRAYRKTEAGKASMKKSNDKQNRKRKTRSAIAQATKEKDPQ